MSIQITIVDDWKKHYSNSDTIKALKQQNKTAEGNFSHQQLILLKRAEETIRENIELFIGGLQEEDMPIPSDFVFNLLIKDERWFITEKNSQIIFEV